MFDICCPLRPLAQIEISLVMPADMSQIIYPKNLTMPHSLNRLDIAGMNGVFCENLGMRIYIQKFFQASLGILSCYAE